jgi:alpha-galactosidase
VTQCGELTITQDYRLAGQVKDPNTKVAHKVGGGQDKDKLGSERGQSISPFRWGIGPDYVSNASYPAQYWSGNSSYRFVFMILNTQDSMEHMFFNLAESWAIRSGRQYSVYDMGSHTENGTAVRNMTLPLLPHGAAALLLNDAGQEPEGREPYCIVYYQCSFPNGMYHSN